MKDTITQFFKSSRKKGCENFLFSLVLNQIELLCLTFQQFQIKIWKIKGEIEKKDDLFSHKIWMIVV